MPYSLTNDGYIHSSKSVDRLPNGVYVPVT